MSDVLVRIEGLRKSFATGEAQIDVLKGIDLTIEAGERVAIVGQSGVGKSTLLHILGTLDQPSSGRIEFRG
jgi:lipoprotein-releasing system ATP-binding protein